jgi:CDP-L-myo-inositol myo-inositolphosphotransferase
MRADNDSISHKILSVIGEISLYRRTLLSLRSIGITNVIIVLGYKSKLLQKQITSERCPNIKVSYIECKDWEKGNGISLLSAEKAINSNEFFLLMGDHWIHPEIFSEMLNYKDKFANFLAVDTNLNQIHDLSNATKIALKDGQTILSASKNLTHFQAVDCGLFFLKKSIYKDLKENIQSGNCSVTGLINKLAQKNLIHAVPIGNLPWENINTPSALNIAKKKFWTSLQGKNDGLVSRFLNRNISRYITTFALKLKMSPTQMSIIAFLVAIISSLGFVTGHLFIGGVCAQFSSILDGSDGEIARASFSQSQFGSVLDQYLDRFADVIIIGGAGIYLLSNDTNLISILFVSLALVLAPMSFVFKMIFKSIYNIDWDKMQGDKYAKFAFGTRDARLFFILIGGIFKLILVSLILITISSLMLLFLRLINVFIFTRSKKRIA